MRTIPHLNLDAFFCAVEELEDPSLHGKPFAMDARPKERGVVASCSYAAAPLEKVAQDIRQDIQQHLGNAELLNS